MGRPRAFDEVAVLDASVGQFRVHGFADTSTEQLCEAAGVSRSSLYNSFISKDDLFVRALERHVSVSLQQQAVILKGVGLCGGERLVVLLESVLSEEADAREKGHAAGCMVVASRMAPDLAAGEPRIRRILDSFHEAQVSLIADAVREGLRDGSLRDGVVPSEGALMITSAIFGIRVLSQAGTPVEMLRRVAGLQLDALRA
jgi:AcrR family transcriptional regulator